MKKLIALLSVSFIFSILTGCMRNNTSNEEVPEQSSPEVICEHTWDDGVKVEGGNDAYLMEYTCTVCGEKSQQIITIIPEENTTEAKNGLYSSAKGDLFCIVYGDTITLSRKIDANAVTASSIVSQAYKFILENGYYKGENEGNTISFKFNEDNLNLKLDGKTYYLTLEENVSFNDEIIEISKPNNVNIDGSQIFWHMKVAPYESGILNSCLEILSKENELLKTEYINYIPEPASMFLYDLNNMKLAPGEYILSIKYSGGLHLKNNAIYQSFDSDAVIFSVTVTNDNNYIISPIVNDIVEKETNIKGIDGATRIEVVKYDIGEVIGTITVTEEASVNHIVDNLNSLKLKELKYNEPTAIEYELTFYNADEEIMKTISITLDGWVDYHGYFHSVVGGELDMVYIAGLFNAPDEEPGQNDILYAAAYPEDFEYNDINYRLVQGDGLKTTATQEELGELLGYIIREKDVSAFTQEYPSVDYVIDNGIYDYYTNNRVALYSLKSYPDLSIIGMRQLGDYVLFQSEGEQDLQFEIRDRAKEENLPCDDALEMFYEDESNEYIFSAIKSQYVIVIYNDGTSEDIVTALNAGRVTIADLDEFGIEYHINPKQ